MPTLILQLPLPGETAPAEYAYVLSADGQQASAHGQAAAAMLPAPGNRSLEVVAVVPAQALSWHRLSLPERVLRSVLSGRSDPARTRAVLAGALEERLLDDAEQLHLAVFAADASTRSAAEGYAGNAWVASCASAWLQSSLQALETAGYPVARVVASCTPQAPGEALIRVLGDAANSQLLLCTDQGVACLPLGPVGLGLAQAYPAARVEAEAAALGPATTHWGSAVEALPPGAALLRAAASPWNLAQGAFAASPQGRLRKRLAAGWQQFAHAPAWRPARWGLWALVGVQLVGLNALAWQQSRQLEAQRAAIQAVLQQTFPEVQYVVDAPLQMQRAVQDLARTRGAESGLDVASLVSTLATLGPKDLVLNGITLSGRQLVLSVQGLDNAALPALQSAYASQGLRAQLDNGQLRIEPQEAP